MFMENDILRNETLVSGEIVKLVAFGVVRIAK
jgi:hypothetical protein